MVFAVTATPTDSEADVLKDMLRDVADVAAVEVEEVGPMQGSSLPV